jgi:PAS domain-containing protein
MLGDIKADGTISFTFVSEGGLRFLGWPREALLGRLPAEFIHPDDARRFGATFAAALECQAATGDPEAAVPFTISRRFRRRDDDSWAMVLTSGAGPRHLSARTPRLTVRSSPARRHRCCALVLHVPRLQLAGEVRSIAGGHLVLRLMPPPQPRGGHARAASLHEPRVAGGALLFLLSLLVTL